MNMEELIPAPYLRGATEAEIPSLAQAQMAYDRTIQFLQECASSGKQIPPRDQVENTFAAQLDRSSIAWGFYILMMNKPHRSLRDPAAQPMMPLDTGISALQHCIDEHLICAKCHAHPESSLKRCSQCKKVSYCSKNCQIAAWKGGHKATCRKAEAS